MERRDFIKATAIGLVGLALVPNVFAEERTILYGDGIHDDTKALQAFLDGKKVFSSHGYELRGFASDMCFKVTDTLRFDGLAPVTIVGSHFSCHHNKGFLEVNSLGSHILTFHYNTIQSADGYICEYGISFNGLI